MTYGPSQSVSQQIHAEKYRGEGETFESAMDRIAYTLSDDAEHFVTFRHLLLHQCFLPAGRIQASIGSARKTTAFNCFVSAPIEDSMDGIMKAARDAAMTMRMGGGIGYDFSTLRPAGAEIKSLGSPSSGPVSFMKIFDAVCGTISSAGSRRGAQMGVLRVDHPDILEFIDAKKDSTSLTNFNISVGVTDEFMRAVKKDELFDLQWGGEVYREISARELWDRIMASTWDWAEPGVLFLDRINQTNSLQYCETITASNPCAEQPLPSNGACLLGSFNLVKYVRRSVFGGNKFDYREFIEDIPVVVRAMDNVINRTDYPLHAQEDEAKAKRRMGIGVTGLANAVEALGHPYGSKEFLAKTENILRLLANECYRASARLAKEKGTFPLYKAEEYESAPFIWRLDADVISEIKEFGLRNSHLTSIAPTGTISLAADNVSSGIEPVFAKKQARTIRRPSGEETVEIEDYGVRVFGTEPRTADQCRTSEHLNVLQIASWWSDSAVSKTCNVGPDVSYDEFKEIYMHAWEFGAKGCTTFRSAGKRFGILNVVEEPESPKEDSGSACFIDPETGQKECA